MKKKSLLITSIVLASLSLTSCGEMKPNTEESKATIKEVINKYKNGEVKLPDTKSVTVKANSLTSLSYDSTNYSISANGEFGLSTEKLYLAGDLSATVGQDTYGAKLKAEVSDKTYLGIEIKGIPDDIAPVITLMGLKTNIKGTEDYSFASFVEDNEINFDEITSIPGFELTEEQEKAIDDFLAKGEDEVKYYAFNEGNDLVIKVEVGKTGIENNIKAQLEADESTTNYTVTVDADAKIFYQAKFDAESYLISSITAEANIATITISDGTDTTSLANLVSTANVDFTFGGEVSTLPNKDKYTDSISEEIGKWIVLISSLVGAGGTETI